MFKFDENAVLEALVIENFLERSASQLTYHGLSELTTSMEDDEIGVLFRNNHFSTIYKVVQFFFSSFYFFALTFKWVSITAPKGAVAVGD